ncbi:hypothetical protein [Saccharopolyspora pogona]|uniref:hypothetical protein n=1 Tax=Saccharopolyspora pogona TaxID=333966 RepID=UPI001684906A|nr:hypothetical protein [Saccharopolyspora pogona]
MTSIHSRSRRRGAVLTAALALAATAVVVSPAAPAQAALGDLLCPYSSGYAVFEPPLQSGVTSTVTAHVSTNNPLPCHSPNGSHPELAWYDEAVNGTATVSDVVDGGGLCNLLFTLTGTGRLTWSDGTTSDDEITFQTDPAKPQTLGGSATITRGTLQGDTVTIAEGVITPNLDCATAGLSRLDFHQATNIFS